MGHSIISYQGEGVRVNNARIAAIGDLLQLICHTNVNECADEARVLQVWRSSCELGEYTGLYDIDFDNMGHPDVTRVAVLSVMSTLSRFLDTADEKIDSRLLPGLYPRDYQHGHVFPKRLIRSTVDTIVALVRDTKIADRADSP